MLQFHRDNPHKKSIINVKHEKSLTNRSISEEHNLTNNVVPPWSGEQYYLRIKQNIKDRSSHRKKSETVRSGYERFLEKKSKEKTKRVNTVNLILSNVYQDSNQVNWHTVMPKKLSSKVFSKNLMILQKTPDPSQKASKETPSVLSKQILHNRKESIKHLSKHSKGKLQKLPTEADYDAVKMWKEEKYRLNKGYDKKSFLFFFQTKNSNKISDRERMVYKLRNLERGKVQRAMTQHY